MQYLELIQYREIFVQILAKKVIVTFMDNDFELLKFGPFRWWNWRTVFLFAIIDFQIFYCHIVAMILEKDRLCDFL
jgi:hypothetical protein